MVNYDIQVTELEETLTNNNGKVVMWNLVLFEVKNESESPASINKQWSQHSKIEHHIFSQAETELRSFPDSTYGFFLEFRSTSLTKSENILTRKDLT